MAKIFTFTKIKAQEGTLITKDYHLEIEIVLSDGLENYSSIPKMEEALSSNDCPICLSLVSNSRYMDWK